MDKSGLCYYKNHQPSLCKLQYNLNKKCTIIKDIVNQLVKETGKK